MSVTPEQLLEKRLRAEQLRQEIATLELAQRSDQVVADLENQDAALDEEIARLEREKNQKIELAVRQGGGSVTEALAAMEEAANAAKAAAEAAANEEANKLAPASRPTLGASSSASTEGEGK